MISLRTAPVPAIGFGGDQDGLEYALLDVVPFAVEFRATQRVSLRLQPSLRFLADAQAGEHHYALLGMDGGSRVYGGNLQLSVPFYLGERARRVGFVGPYVAPFVAGWLVGERVEGSGGISTGWATDFAGVGRLKLGGWIGVGGAPFLLDAGYLAEVGVTF